MAERALKNALEKYNLTIENNYKSNWGSLLSFLGKLSRHLWLLKMGLTLECLPTRLSSSLNKSQALWETARRLPTQFQQ